MTTTPDPKIVFEAARQAIAEMAFRYDAVGSVLDARGLDRQLYGDVVVAAIDAATVAVSWPDEQLQDERDATADYGVLGMLLTRDRGVLSRNEEAAIRALLAAQSKRDSDVRAVDNAIKAIMLFWSGEAPIETLAEVRAQLIERYGSQIARLDAAAIEARDAKGALRERVAELGEFAEEER